jgi:hypothetical protein
MIERYHMQFGYYHFVYAEDEHRVQKYNTKSESDEFILFQKTGKKFK